MDTTLIVYLENQWKLIDLYESDKESNTSLPGYQGPILTNPCIYVNNLPDEVPYSEVCPCNPKNGGNGICGCVLPNKMVPNPKNGGSGICGCTIGNKLVEHPFLRTYSTSTANVGKVDNENSND